MERFKAFDPNTEVHGQMILGFLRSAWAEDVAPLIEKHGFASVKPNEWYSQQAWLDFLTDLYQRPDAQSRLVSVGLKLGEMLPFPEEIETLEEALNYLIEGNRHAHRSGDYGTERLEKVNDKEYRAILKTPYPDDSVYGLFWSVTRVFTNKNGHDFIIRSNHAGKRRYPTEDSDPLIITITLK